MIALALKGNNSVRSLSLQYNKITASGCIALMSILDKTVLESINLCCNSIGTEAAPSIGFALSRTRTLSELALGANRIGNETAFAIAAALEKNESLGTLTLGGNMIGSDALVAIFRALKSNKSLRRLDVGNNDSSSIAELTAALQSNTALCEYDDLGLLDPELEMLLEKNRQLRNNNILSTSTTKGLHQFSAFSLVRDQPISAMSTELNTI